MSVKIEELRAEFTADTAKFDKGAKGILRRMDKVKAEFRDMGRSFVRVGATITKAVVGIGAAMTGIAAVSVKMAADFQKNFAEVETLLSGVSETAVDGLRQGVRGLAVEFGKSTKEMTAGLYQIISAGASAEDAIGLLRTAGKAAVGGVAEVSEAINLGSAVMKGYGKTWKDLGQIYDVAFTTVKLGQTTFAELASSIGKIAPFANSAGISLQELAGAYATLTGVTGNTAEVTTQLRGLIQAFIAKPSADAAKTIKKMGLEWDIAALKAKGLRKALMDAAQTIRRNTKTDAEFLSVIKQLVPSIESLPAALALTGAQAKDFENKTKAMYAAVGATNEAFEKVARTVSVKWGQAVAIIKDMAIELGTGLLPIVSEVLGQFQNWFKANRSLINQNIGKFTKWVAEKFKDVKAALPGIIAGIRDWIKWAHSLGVEWVKIWEDPERLIDPIIAEVERLKPGITGLLADIGQSFLMFLDGDWAKGWDRLVEMAISAWSEVQPAVVGFLADIGSIFLSFVDGDWSAGWDKAQAVMQRVFNWLSENETFTKWANEVLKIINMVQGYWNTLVNSVKNLTVKDVGKAALDALTLGPKMFAKANYDALKHAAIGAANLPSDLLDAAVNSPPAKESPGDMTLQIFTGGVGNLSEAQLRKLWGQLQEAGRRGRLPGFAASGG